LSPALALRGIEFGGSWAAMHWPMNSGAYSVDFLAYRAFFSSSIAGSSVASSRR
jgi:hypothetical protein